MLAGVGTDILSVERMRNQIVSAAFVRRVFTAAEISAGRERPDPASYYAKVFAAKEAVFKCFGISADQFGTWLDIEIHESEEVHPEVRLSGLMARHAQDRNVRKVLLSLSCETDYAVAFAAIVREVPDDD
jgi:phosphopantetheine--protein transferase-like protein